MVRLNSEVAKALEAAGGDSLMVEIPGIDQRFVLVAQETHSKAVEALRREHDRKAIAAGIADMEAGRTQPLEQVSAEIRAELIRKFGDGT